MLPPPGPCRLLGPLTPPPPPPPPPCPRQWDDKVHGYVEPFLVIAEDQDSGERGCTVPCTLVVVVVVGGAVATRAWVCL